MILNCLRLTLALADSPRKDALLGGGGMKPPRAPENVGSTELQKLKMQLFNLHLVGLCAGVWL